ncbi:MAG TPA: Mth938-like domain-containing protein [Stellaceae bacterium]|nr:Mth938-like domain-containing protein [Stellaceae bacterium]
MDLIPLTPPGRQIIERYAASGFRISGVIHRGPVLVFPDCTLAWTVTSAAALSAESLQPVAEHGGVQILLIGLGQGGGIVPDPVRAALRAAGIAIEAMGTGAACRTYNVLIAEDRRVAAALLPAD